MRNIRWLFSLAVLVCLCAARTLAINYSVGEPISLTVRMGATSAIPGQTVMISAAARDFDFAGDNNMGQRVEDLVTISYQATGGELLKRSTTANPVDLAWTAPNTPGVYAIVVTAQDGGRFFPDKPVTRLIQITVSLPGGQPFMPTVRVAATPQTIRLDRNNTATTVTATVFGEDAAGKPVRFFATGGRLSAATATTDQHGVAMVRLTVTRADEGAITVAAFYTTTTSTTSVQVVTGAPHPIDPGAYLPPPPVGNTPAGFMVTVDPPQLPADGRSTARVMIRLADPRGLPMPNQNVIFRSTIGILAPQMSRTDINGVATALLTATDVPTGGYVIVNSGTSQAYATVVLTPTDEQRQSAGPPHIYLTVDPTEQMADGAAKVMVSALVLDATGRPVGNMPVAFSTSLGTVQQPVVRTNEDGVAATKLVAPDRPGLAVVTVATDQETAASQVQFTGGVADATGIEIKRWIGQSNAFVTPNWLYREYHIEDGTQTVTGSELRIYDALGLQVKLIPLGAHGTILRDQNGVAHGYSLEDNDTATVVILNPDATLDHALSIPLLIGSHLKELRYAEPAGNVLVTLAQPDGTRPEVRFYGKDGALLLNLSQGLERLPVVDLGSDGYLAMALPGGTVRAYSPGGQLVFEGRRTDGLQAVTAAIGPNGEWLAVGAALAGQTERAPVISVFSRQSGLPFVSFPLEAKRLTPVSGNALVVATPDSTAYLNLPGKAIVWKIDGSHDRFLPAGNVGILAGHHSEQENGVSVQVTAVGLRDGKMITAGKYDMGRVIALTPPADDGTMILLGSTYAINFTVPK